MDWIPPELVDLYNEGSGGLCEGSLGLLIALVGFYLTYRAAKKSKTAAEAASAAVAKIRKDMRKVDTISDLTQAVATMEEIKTLHREGPVVLLPGKYFAVRQLLIAIKGANPGLSSEHRKGLQGAIQHFSNLERQIDEALVNDRPPSDVPLLNEIVSKQEDRLQAILAELRLGIGV